MADITAVYLDLTDVESARLWRWLRVVGLTLSVEVRPFCRSVGDPWDCEVPPFGLELLMLLEHARADGPATVVRVVDAVISRARPDHREVHGELGFWLAVGREAGVDLREFEDNRERLRAEVGYWQAEAIRDLGVEEPSTLAFSDGSVMRVQLRDDMADDDARRLLDRLREELTAPVPAGPGEDRPHLTGRDI